MRLLLPVAVAAVAVGPATDGLVVVAAAAVYEPLPIQPSSTDQTTLNI